MRVTRETAAARTGDGTRQREHVRLSAHDLGRCVENVQRLLLGEASFVEEMVPEELQVGLRAVVRGVDHVEVLVRGLVCIGWRYLQRPFVRYGQYSVERARTYVGHLPLPDTLWGVCPRTWLCRLDLEQVWHWHGVYLCWCAAHTTIVGRCSVVCHSTNLSVLM